MALDMALKGRVMMWLDIVLLRVGMTHGSVCVDMFLTHVGVWRAPTLLEPMNRQL